jgi:hypothetical protein
VIAHQRRHQGRAEGAHLAARVVEREGRDVQLAVYERVPLLVRLEQRRARIDLDVQVHACGFCVARNDLHHLVAHVSLAAGKLVRRAQYHRRRQGRTGRQGARERRRNATPFAILHVSFLQITRPSANGFPR